MAGSSAPWWSPESEGELRASIDQGLLQETHFLELKRELAGGASANKELARDLSALGVDGGLLIIGVGESEGQPFLHPVPLHQVAERIEQVARTLIQPRLSITVTNVASVDDPSRGYVLVNVHSSLMAPHMVDHRYYGRAEKTKYVMDDGEIERLHRQRRVVEQNSQEVLDWLISRDPVVADRRHAHFFFIARPNQPRQDLAVELIRRFNYSEGFRAILRESARTVPPVKGQSSTPFEHLTNTPARRLDGIALASDSLTYERRPNSESRSPENISEIELAENGEVRVFVGELSKTRQQQFDHDADEVIIDSWVPELTRQSIAVAAEVARNFDYRGTWSLGVVLTGIGGLTIASSTQNLMREPRRLEVTADQYRAWAGASSDELMRKPGSLTAALVGRFLRSADIEQLHLDGLLSDLK